MICHLIGLNHCYQYRGFRDVNWEAFDACLFSFCRSARVLLIAEELSQESVEKWAFRGAQGSVAMAVASRLGIEHQFCDPSPLERKALGVPSTDELKSSLSIGVAMTHLHGEIKVPKRAAVRRDRAHELAETFGLSMEEAKERAL